MHLWPQPTDENYAKFLTLTTILNTPSYEAIGSLHARSFNNIMMKLPWVLHKYIRLIRKALFLKSGKEGVSKNW